MERISNGQLNVMGSDLPGLPQQIVLQTHLGDLIQLCFQPIQVSFLIDQIRVN